MELSELVALTRNMSPDRLSQSSLKITTDDYDEDLQGAKDDFFVEMSKVVQRGNARQLKKLLQKREYIATLDYKNSEGETILHLAADRSDSECVKALLEAGANPNTIDNYGRLPLHLVLDGGCRCENCSRKNANCVKCLIDGGTNIDIEDDNKETPLHYAAKNMMPNCATILLENGADINRKTKGKNIGFLLVQKIPEVMTGELDKGVVFDEQDSSMLQLDFKVILQSDSEKISTDGRKETDLLNFMLRAHKAGREALLTHPLTEAFLYLKWTAVSKWFWIIRILYYLLAVLYTVFIFNVFLVNCPTEYDHRDQQSLNESSNESEEGEGDCVPTTVMYVMGSLMSLGVLCMIFNELYEIYYDKMDYFRIGLNYAWWMLILTVCTTVVPAFGTKPREWQYPVASFGVFYAWAMTLVQVGRIPQVGVYVEMLGKVLKDFAIFSATYFALLLGFALGFCVLFPQSDMFDYEKIPLALMKSLLIMIGESDYEGLLYEEENPRVGTLQYSIVAHVIFAGFIIIMTIVLMNLLLGLAVSDIQELQKTAAILRVTRQIQQIALFESLIYSKMLPFELSEWAITHFSIISLAATEGTLFRFSPTDPEDRSLPEDMKAKFIPYLTSSPCLNRKRNLRNKIQLGALKAIAINMTTSSTTASGRKISRSGSVYNTGVLTPVDNSADGQMQQQINLLENLQAAVVELQKKIEELSSKVDR